MNKNIVLGVLGLLALVLMGLYLNNKIELGRGSGVNHYQSENFLQGLTAGSRDQIAITIANGTATSSLKVLGCYNTYATSSVTAIHHVYVTTGATTTFAGTVFWKYGHNANCN